MKKICSSCYKKKEVGKFTKKAKARDGLCPYCKECKRIKAKESYRKNRKVILERNKKWRLNNLEKCREACRKWRLRNQKRCRENRKRWFFENPERHKEMKKKGEKNYNLKYPERLRAKRKAQYRRNILRKKACEICSFTQNLEMHHENYFKPLEVITLYRSCHVRITSEKMKGGEQYSKSTYRQ